MTDVISVLGDNIAVVESGGGVQVIQTSSQTPLITIGNSGPQGIPGPQGAQGAAGTNGTNGTGDKTFTQSLVSVTNATITHNLGKYVSTTVLDTAGDEVVVDIDQLNNNQLTISFGNSFSGTVICN